CRIGDARHRRLHFTGHGDEEIDLARMIAGGGARGNEIALGIAEALLERRGLCRIERPELQRAADRSQDLVARVAHAALPARRRSAQRLWNVRPSGAGMSRPWVQPPASGSERKRPRDPPMTPRSRAPN